MEIFNRKLNMINIAGLIILLFIVKHGHAAVTTPPTSATTSATSGPAVATKITTVNPTSTPIAPSANGTTTKMNMSTSSPSTGPTGPTGSIKSKTTPLPTTTAPKPPDTCYMYEISCNKATCPAVYENKTVHFPNDVKMCNRTDTGFCFVNKIVDSKNQSIANYTMGCNTNCNYKKDITGCCNSNLCNGDLSLLNSGQYVKYNFLMSVLCIAISLFRLDIYF